jgi:hypothetical protein
LDADQQRCIETAHMITSGRTRSDTSTWGRKPPENAL